MLNKEHEFIEGIAYDLNNSIIMYGDFANEAPRDKVCDLAFILLYHFWSALNHTQAYFNPFFNRSTPS